MASQVTALFSTKGGVTKTTLAGNLSALLADHGHRVLLVGAGLQQSAGAFYDIDTLAPGGFVRFVTREGIPRACISHSAIAGLDLVIGNDVNKALSAWIKYGSNRGVALKVAINAVRPDCDLIFIATQGSDGIEDLQELAVGAAERLLMPVIPEAVVARELLSNGFNVLASLAPRDPADTLNVLPIAGVLICQYTPGNRSRKACCRGLRDHIASLKHEGRAYVLATGIPRSVVYNDAQTQRPRLPVHRYEPKRRSRDQTIPCAAESMSALAEEHFGHVLQHNPVEVIRSEPAVC